MLSVKGKCEFLCATCVRSDVFFLQLQLYFHQFTVTFQLTSAPRAQSAYKQRARAAALLYAALFFTAVFFFLPPSHLQATLALLLLVSLEEEPL